MPLSIRTKLTLAVGLLISGLLAGSAWFTVEQFRAALVEELFREQYAMLSSQAEELDTRLITAHLVLEAAANSFPREVLSDPDRTQAVLDERSDLHKVFDNHVFVFTPEGRIHCESPFAPDRRGKDFSFREYIRKTLAEKRPYISDPYISSQPHKHPVIMMTAPILDKDGRLRAILAASLDLMGDNFLGKLAERKVGRSGYYYLTTGDRIMIMHPDRGRIFKPVPVGINPAYDAAIAGFQGTTKVTNSYARQVYVSFKRLHGKDWLLAANYPIDEALAPLNVFSRQVILLALAGVVLTALLIHILLGRLLKPMTALTQHMAALADRRGKARLLPVVSSDETGQLTLSFNKMVQDLDHQQTALENQEALYRTVVRFATDFIYWRNADKSMRYVSENSALLTGYPPEAFYASPSLLDEIVHPEDRSHWQDHFHRAVAGETEERHLPLEFRLITASGDTRWVSHLCQPVIDEQGRTQGVRGSHADITPRKQSEARLRLAGAVFESAREAILVSDADNRIVAVNPAFTLMTGYSEAEVLGKNPRLLQSGRTPRDGYPEMWRNLSLHGSWHGEFANRRKDGGEYYVLAAISAIRDDQGRVTHYVGIESDITAMKEAELRIEYLAYHDPLTGLPNRALLLERAYLALAVAHRRQEKLAILFLDLDRFKDVNDSLGHGAGDALLMEAGRRLGRLVRDTDTASRLGGDEFVLMLMGVGEEGAREVGEKVLAAMREPFTIEGHDLSLSTSVGIALYPQDGADMGELLKNADAALYQAKQDGRNTAAFYNPDMNVATFERLVLETELKHAIDHGELVVYYQPKMDLRDNRMVGAEALVRWLHPQHGLVPPSRFIPLAETSGLINDISRWVMGAVGRQIADWRGQGLALFPVSINLAPRDFHSSQLASRLRDLLQTYSLPASALELELTESTLLDSGDQVSANLMAIKRMGISLALDDFGTGYSSLGYLRRLPISVLKIDQSFVRNLETDLEDRTLAGSIIALGNSQRLTVVAEGVETAAQRDILLQLGCPIGQGYYFARPMPADQFAAWLQALTDRTGSQAVL
jgi:diguanylate cyclase (GGDEF)-like protein/PAS domain S-box-containing protein